MASREKRPLASSKSKQRANNNDSGVPSSPSKNKKGKTLPAFILEAVATGSTKLSPKLESTLPRKKVIASLKCKKKLRATKGTLLKVNSTKNEQVKKRLTATNNSKASKSLSNRAKRVTSVSKSTEEEADSVSPDIFPHLSPSLTPTKLLKPLVLADYFTKGVKGTPTAKSSTEKKTYGTVRNISLPPFSKKIIDFFNCPTLKNKTSPSTGAKNPNCRKLVISPTNKNSIDLTIDEVLAKSSDTEMEGDTEKSKTRSKLVETETKKVVDRDDVEKSDDDADTTPEGQGAADQSKKKTSPRNLRNGKLRQSDHVAEVESKKDRVDDITPAQSCTEEANGGNTMTDFQKLHRVLSKNYETELVSDGTVIIVTPEGYRDSSSERDSSRVTGSVIDGGPNLRSKTKAKSTDAQSKNEDTDGEEELDNFYKGNFAKPKKRRERRFEIIEETPTRKSRKSKRPNNHIWVPDNPEHRWKRVASIKKPIIISDTLVKTENNERVGVSGNGSEGGPNLRSKTKAKSTDIPIKVETDVDSNDGNSEIASGSDEGINAKAQDADPCEDDNLDDDEVIMVGRMPSKDPTFTDLTTEPRKRLETHRQWDEEYHKGSTDVKKIIDDRSKRLEENCKRPDESKVLNIDVKKPLGTRYNNETTDCSTAPKSQIDQMIENIKLTIAKSIENKIYGGDKTLGFNKAFEVPKPQDIVSLLNTDTHDKIIHNDIEDLNNKPNASKSEIDSNCSTDADNSLPKVADTAKEIEKLVMGDSKLTVDKNVKAAEETNLSNEQSINESEDITVSMSSPSNEGMRPESVASQSCSTEHDKDQDNPQSCSESGADAKEEILEPGDSMETNDSETLETISREVERLVTETVAENEPAKSQNSDTQPKTDDSLTDDIAALESTLEASDSALTDAEVENALAESLCPIIQDNSLQESIEEQEKPKTNNPEEVYVEKSGKNTQDKPLCQEEVNKAKDEKPATEETKCVVEETRRVLRARDKLKKVEKSSPKASEASDSVVKAEIDAPDDQSTESSETKPSKEEVIESPVVIKIEEPEPQTRTRRSRDAKKRKEEISPVQSLKTKRNRRETRRNDQQNKEETLLDNEVAKINENKRSFSAEKLSKRINGTESLRGFLAEDDRIPRDKSNNRSKSENDIDSTKGKRLSRGRCETDEPKDSENREATSDVDHSKTTKTPENLQKDSDEASTSGESTSSVSQILETPEDKARKESILRLLGLESMEKAAERMHQKAKREQYTTGTLKTVIRVQKDKKRSRSPLKLVFNRQGRTDGEGVSPEFYTIQKELGTSGLGDSSSGANRKFSTNHRQSCDEDNEETPSKERQPLIIPEKSSSFSIHPGRLCADVCCYCFGKFGSLDTPMHLAQLKSDERRKKILSVERHLTKDSCLCDACYRHVDRKANVSPTNSGPKPQRVHRQLLVSKCYVKDCRNAARHLVKRRWLHKIKSCVQNRMNFDINWEPSQHTSMSFCVDHYAIIEKYLTCSLCTRRLAKNATRTLNPQETEELNRLLEQQGIPIDLEPGTYVCKLCRYFSQVQLKYKDVENMNANHRSFSKSYRKRILHYNDIEVMENEEDEESSQSTSSKDKRKKSKNSQNKSSLTKSSEDTIPAEKTSSESSAKPEASNSGETEQAKAGESPEEVPPSIDTQVVDLESTVEKLKKRKALDQHLYSTDSPVFSENGSGGTTGADVVEILAMDKEVTLTRLPKRPRISNDITPVVQRLGANPSISVRTLFPGEEEMGLHANVEFSNVREVTPQGWEKCATVIQYDRDTKVLWQELQRPYGNQSSFLRHLILLEKYYRSGDLVLAPNASRNAINYSTSVQNRLISYEGPEKMDEPITEPITSEFASSRRLSGGYMLERDRLSLPSTSTIMTSATVTSTPIKSSANLQQSVKSTTAKVSKLNPGVSIIKKPPPNLQRLNLPSSSGASATNGSSKRKDTYPNKLTGSTSGGKFIQLSEPDFKRYQSLKKQRMLSGKINTMTPTSSALGHIKANLQYQKAQMAAQTQFQKHLRMQQEMLNRQSRGDFEPLICDVRSLVNENTPAQNLLNNLNLPRSIQVTTKPSITPIPILPKIPKSLTVIPQTVPRPVEK